MRVYLVDDDAYHRRALLSLLEMWRFSVIGQAGDGLAALRELAGVGPVDLILTDCQMPGMDGIALTRALRARGDRTPLIMLSGQTCGQVIDAALKAGVDCYLRKPLDIRHLADAVRRLLPSSRVA